MANATGTPQSMLYQARGSVPSNRDRSFEQMNTNSGNPMQPIFNTNYNTMSAQYSDPYNGQAPQFGRYTPPTLSNAGTSNNPQWNSSTGGYAYNLPNAYGGYQGIANYGNQNWLQNYLANGGPQAPQFSTSQPQRGMGVPNSAGMRIPSTDRMMAADAIMPTKPMLQNANGQMQDPTARIRQEQITPIFNPGFTR